MIKLATCSKGTSTQVILKSREFVLRAGSFVRPPMFREASPLHTTSRHNAVGR